MAWRLISCSTLNNSVNLSVPQFLTWKMRIIIATTSMRLLCRNLMTIWVESIDIQEGLEHLGVEPGDGEFGSIAA